MLVWSLNIIPLVLFFGSFILSFYYTTFPRFILKHLCDDLLFPDLREDIAGHIL